MIYLVLVNGGKGNIGDNCFVLCINHLLHKIDKIIECKVDILGLGETFTPKPNISTLYHLIVIKCFEWLT